MLRPRAHTESLDVQSIIDNLVFEEQLSVRLTIWSCKILKDFNGFTLVKKFKYLLYNKSHFKNPNISAHDCMMVRLLLMFMRTRVVII
jgi:hypothetical protein